MHIQGLSLRVGQRVLIEALDLHMIAGQCWCIIGRNGAGKSTLLRSLAGLRLPDAGHIFLDQRVLADWPIQDLARRRAYLPQARHDAFGYRVIETILSARHPHHENAYWESEQDLALANAALMALDVLDLAERDVRTLSGGERQRVAIAATLAQDASLMLLDEPVNSLDLAHQVSVMKLLKSLCQLQSKTVLLVSHDLNLAQCIATHALLLMADGSWHAGPADSVMQAPLLSTCLGHPIEMIEQGGRRIFLPAH
jgi:iron complex transport system ATP-binding protein